MQFVHDFNEANPPRSARTALPHSAVLHVSVPPLLSVFVDAGCFMDGSTGWGLVIH
ncbi:hypothetical protein A2U01_0062850, partial [Trifolium medium]|nr:hypothetical protein [Trifolium medium]